MVSVTTVSGWEKEVEVVVVVDTSVVSPSDPNQSEDAYGVDEKDVNTTGKVDVVVDV